LFLKIRILISSFYSVKISILILKKMRAAINVYSYVFYILSELTFKLLIFPIIDGPSIVLTNLKSYQRKSLFSTLSSTSFFTVSLSLFIVAAQKNEFAKLI